MNPTSKAIHNRKSNTHPKPGNIMRMILPGIFLFLLISVLLFACGGSSNSNENKPAAAQTNPDGTDNPDVTQNIVQRKALRWTDLYSQCALVDNGTPYCWGDVTSPYSSSPVQISDSNFISLSLKQLSACGVSADGKLFCWGSSNAEAEVLYSPTLTASSAPVAVAPDKNFSSVETNGYNACALEVSGKLYCWGRNDDGLLLGIGSAEDKFRDPTPVDTESLFADYSFGGDHMCALEPGGKAYCWGDNTSGELGDGTNNPSNSPVAVETELLFRQILAVSAFTCALSSDYDVYCWGGSSVFDWDSTTPKKVDAGDLKFSVIHMAGPPTICGITRPEGLLYCWGSIYQIKTEGSSSDDTNLATPQKVATTLKFKRLTLSGDLHNCGIATDDQLYCWGTGALSVGTVEEPKVPNPVEWPVGVSGIIFIP